MQELLRILQLIQLINSVTGPWEVLHHAGDGELNEETAEKLGDGDVAGLCCMNAWPATLSGSCAGDQELFFACDNQKQHMAPAQLV